MKPKLAETIPVLVEVEKNIKNAATTRRVAVIFLLSFRAPEG